VDDEITGQTKMKYFSVILLIFLCIAVMCATGCTSQPETPVVPPQSTPATAIQTSTGTVVIVTAQIPTPAPVIIIVTPIPRTTDATEVSAIRFSRYSDNDFSVDYPSTWTVTKSVYSPYYCKNNLDHESVTYWICYKNETRFIGPFNYYDDSSLKQQRRIVTFTSAEGTVKFVSFTADFYEGLNGNVMINPTIDWSTTQFEKSYPDLTGYSSKYLGNYRFFSGGSTMTSSYDVTLPTGTVYYPSAYTKKSVITPHHLYSFGFVTDGENFSKYQNLKEYMLASITVNDAA
jgi:hypothetical protein